MFLSRYECLVVKAVQLVSFLFSSEFLFYWYFRFSLQQPTTKHQAQAWGSSDWNRGCGWKGGRVAFDLMGLESCKAIFGPTRMMHVCTILLIVFWLRKQARFFFQDSTCFFCVPSFASLTFQRTSLTPNSPRSLTNHHNHRKLKKIPIRDILKQLQATTKK